MKIRFSLFLLVSSSLYSMDELKQESPKRSPRVAALNLSLIASKTMPSKGTVSSTPQFVSATPIASVSPLSPFAQYCPHALERANERYTSARKNSIPSAVSLTPISRIEQVRADIAAFDASPNVECPKDAKFRFVAAHEQNEILRSFVQDEIANQQEYLKKKQNQKQAPTNCCVIQ